MHAGPALRHCRWARPPLSSGAQRQQQQQQQQQRQAEPAQPGRGRAGGAAAQSEICTSSKALLSGEALGGSLQQAAPRGPRWELPRMLTRGLYGAGAMVSEYEPRRGRGAPARKSYARRRGVRNLLQSASLSGLPCVDARWGAGSGGYIVSPRSFLPAFTTRHSFSSQAIKSQRPQCALLCLLPDSYCSKVRSTTPACLLALPNCAL